MELDKQIGYTKGLAPFDADGEVGYRRLDPIEQPARPLGEKRAALLARRRRSLRSQRQNPARSEASTGKDVRVFSTEDEVLTFALRPTTSGMLVERTYCCPTGPRVVQTMAFDSREQFDRWCANEPVRFHDPMLFDQLCRQGHEVLCS